MSIAKYYPFNGERGRLRLGLNPIGFSEWLQYENDFLDRIKEKKQLINNYGVNVLDAIPKSLPAQKEFLSLVLEHLARFHADRFIISASEIESLEENIVYSFDKYEKCPLELVSYLIADDFCLLEKEKEDYMLVAASVCAPTWWDLQKKMGKPLKDIHAPIVGLESRIGRMIRHFLSNLKVEDCYQRSNWFLFTRPEFCIFPDSFDFKTEMQNIDEKNIESYLFLRSERQTFRKLQKSKHIIFGIKVYVEPISIVKKYPAIAKDLLLALNTMDKEQKHGLGITYVEEPLRTYIGATL